MIRRTASLTEKEDRMRMRMLADISNGTFFEKAAAYTEHAGRKHTGKSTTQLLDQMFDEQKPNASSFSSERDMRNCVEDVLLNLDSYIYLNLRERAKNGRPFRMHGALTDEEYRTPGDEADFQTRHTGLQRCANGDIREISTDVTSVVLLPDDESPYGFRIVTAYPDLCPERDGTDLVDAWGRRIDAGIKPTGRDISKDMFASRVYERATQDHSMLRIYLEEAVDQKRPFDIRYNGNRNGMGYTYDDTHDEMTIIVPTPHPDIDTRVFISPWSMSAKMYLSTPGQRPTPMRMRIDGELKTRLDLIPLENRNMFFANVPDVGKYLQHLESKLARGRAKDVPSSIRSLTDQWDAQRKREYDKETIDY